MLLLCFVLATGDSAGPVTPPAGFVALFNGTDLTGWQGLVDGGPPRKSKLSPAELAAAQSVANAKMRKHWHPTSGILVFDGKGDSLCTIKNYGDFELLVDFKIEAKGDSGIYLRGSPQVQIWDPALNKIGSGGLYNNQKNPANPLVLADNPVGQWNTFRIKMIGDRVTVHLNNKLVTDNVILENYWERGKPIYREGPIELQNHGNNLYFQNVFVREISAAEAAKEEGFSPIFNGKDFSGWKVPAGDNNHWKVVDGVIDYDARSEAAGEKSLATEKEYTNFVLRLEWRLKSAPFLNPRVPVILPTGLHKRDENGKEYVTTVPDADSGVYLRGLPKAQVNIWNWPIGSGEVYGYRMDAKLSPLVRQSVTPVYNADRNVGEWNQFEIKLFGEDLQVTLNDHLVIPNGKLPGLPAKGPLMLQHHGNWKDGKWTVSPSLVQFRNLFIKELAAK